jgi:predicted enzyme related to lactoylglutathione lyase
VPGINGGLYQRPTDESNPMNQQKIYLYDCTIGVTDIDKAIADVKANGGTIIMEKMEMKNIGWFARGKDTEGNIFGLMQSTGKMEAQG